jgi:hypothetical protein
MEPGSIGHAGNSEPAGAPADRSRWYDMTLREIRLYYVPDTVVVVEEQSTSVGVTSDGGVSHEATSTSGSFDGKKADVALHEQEVFLCVSVCMCVCVCVCVYNIYIYMGGGGKSERENLKSEKYAQWRWFRVYIYTYCICTYLLYVYIPTELKQVRAQTKRLHARVCSGCCTCAWCCRCALAP